MKKIMKKIMKKGLLSILLCLCMVCTLLPVTARAAGQTVKVAGIELADGQCITANNAAEATNGDNNGTYVAYFKDGVLHLNGLETTQTDSCIYWGNYATSLIIDVSGENSLTRTGGAAINITNNAGDLTIQGSGTLTVKGSSFGIWASEGVTIQDSVTAHITGETKSAIASNCGNAHMLRSKITIKGTAKVTAVGGEYGIAGDNGGQPQIILEDNAELTANGGTHAIYAAPAINYTYQWRTSDSGEYTPSTTTLFTNNPAPSYVEIKPSDISLSQTGTHTFTAATVGYAAAPTALTVTVTNNGTDATGALSVALSGTNHDSFTLGTTSISDIAVGGTASFTVQPTTGLNAGTYTATVTVSGNDIAASFDVSFTVNPVTYSVNITGGTGMTTDGNPNQTVEQNSAMINVVYTATDGYYFPENYPVATQSGVSVIRNSFTQITVSGTPATNVSLTLPAATAKTQETTPTAAFTATGPDTGTLSGVDIGMKYSTNGGSTWTDINSNANVDLTDLAAGIISVVKKGGNTTVDSEEQTIPVTKAAAPSNVVGVACTTDNNNDGKLQNITTAMEYKLSTADDWTDGTGSDITGLIAGAYYVRVKASGTALASDNQTVTVPAYNAPVYSISLDTTETYTFPSTTEGYSALTPLTVTVTNTGTATTGNLHVYLTGNSDMFVLSANTITNIEPNDTATFTVAPKTGLAADEYPYTASVSVMNADHGIEAGFTVKFIVNAAGGSTPAPHSHSGGTATCKDEAVCTECGQPYGSKDSNKHTGGTEVRGKVDATTTTEGYTGDTYCLGCDTKIATGTTIPKKDSDETSGNTDGGDSGNDGNGVNTPPVPADEDISPAYVTYTVQKGDTLWAIAKKYGCTVSEIVTANSALIKNPDLIYAGWQLKIPQGEATGVDTKTPDAILPEDKKTGVYIVRHGDTLWAISKKYGCTVAEIVALNGELITDPDLIYAGWELKLLQD